MQSPVEGCDSQAPALTGWLACNKGPEIMRQLHVKGKGMGKVGSLDLIKCIWDIWQLF